MNQLTPQEAALYLGQEAESTEYKGILSSVSNDGFAALDLGIMGPEWRFVAIEDVKLLLRSLADITEEEAKEIIRIGYEGSKIVIYTITGPFIRCGYEFEGQWYKETIDLNDPITPAEFQYLLSKGFDLFGFIEQGKALDKTRSAPSIEPASFCEQGEQKIETKAGTGAQI